MSNEHGLNDDRALFINLLINNFGYSEELAIQVFEEEQRKARKETPPESIFSSGLELRENTSRTSLFVEPTHFDNQAKYSLPPIRKHSKEESRNILKELGLKGSLHRTGLGLDLSKLQRDDIESEEPSNKHTNSVAHRKYSSDDTLGRK